jgi:hypothetical protein
MIAPPTVSGQKCMADPKPVVVPLAPPTGFVFLAGRPVALWGAMDRVAVWGAMDTVALWGAMDNSERDRGRPVRFPLHSDFD